MATEDPLPEHAVSLQNTSRHDFPRLSIPSPSRILLASLSSSALGMFLGLYQGGKVAQLRFRAEHAHKMPTTTTDWYFYHKSKNYHAAQGGVLEGVKMSARLGFWTTALFSLEHTLDIYRGTADLLNTVIASLTVSGGFSLWNRFPLTTAARTARYGLIFGLVYGGMQDVLSVARGRPVSYVEFCRRRFRRRGDADGGPLSQ